MRLVGKEGERLLRPRRLSRRPPSESVKARTCFRALANTLEFLDQSAELISVMDNVGEIVKEDEPREDGGEASMSFSFVVNVTRSPFCPTERERLEY